MANTFIPLSNTGAAPVATFFTPSDPAFTSVTANTNPPPGTNGSGGIEAYTPILPLPGIIGVGSYAI